MQFPKPVTIKNQKYKDWIKSLCCCVTGRQSVDPNTGERFSDPHHVNFPGHGMMSGKTDDTRTIPLCHDLHLEVHRIGNKAFAEKYDLNLELIIAQLNNKWEDLCNSSLKQSKIK